MAGGSGVSPNLNSAPDVSNFTLVGVGDTIEGDLPPAEDYPWTIVGAVATEGDTPRLFFSDGTAWSAIAFVSDTTE